MHFFLVGVLVGVHLAYNHECQVKVCKASLKRRSTPRHSLRDVERGGAVGVKVVATAGVNYGTYSCSA